MPPLLSITPALPRPTIANPQGTPVSAEADAEDDGAPARPRTPVQVSYGGGDGVVVVWGGVVCGGGVVWCGVRW